MTRVFIAIAVASISFAAHAQTPREIIGAEPVDDDAPPPVLPVQPAPSVPSVPSACVTPVGPIAEYERCTALATDTDPKAAIACFHDVVAKAPGTEAAIRADASASLLVLQAKSSEHNNAPFFLATATGLFGAWNGVAAVTMLNAAAPGAPVQLMAAEYAGGALALGVTYGLGGFYLGTTLNLDEGQTRLVASSLVWGSALGVAFAPSVGSLFLPPPPTSTSTTGAPGASPFVALDAGIATVVVAGLAAGGTAVALATQLPFTDAQVALINSGGWIGGLVGIAATTTIATATTPGKPSTLSPFVYSAAFALPLAAGLVGGGFVGRNVDLTWGEVGLCDLGGVLGVVVGFAGGVVLLSSPAVLTGLPAVGAVVGYGSTLAIVTHLHGLKRDNDVASSTSAIATPTAFVVAAGRAQVPVVGFTGRF